MSPRPSGYYQLGRERIVVRIRVVGEHTDTQGSGCVDRAKYIGTVKERVRRRHRYRLRSRWWSCSADLKDFGN